MPQAPASALRAALVLAAAGLLAACGGSSDDPAAATVPAPSPAPTGDEVRISGRITYDFVPVSNSGGLDYVATEARPARLVTVQFIGGATPLADGPVLAATETDANGDYSLIVPAERTGFVRARAESSQSGAVSWDFRVLDNVNGDAVYSLDGAAQSSGTSDSTRDLHAPSGWTGADYGNERAAAPFAILDTVAVGAEYLAASGVANFPPLDLHWSPENVATLDADGNTNPSTGEIGTSFFAVIPSNNPDLDLNGIYLLGNADNDTEEYDRHLILHEFAHYLEGTLGRSDSIGGPHARGDIVDMRVAFSEGWASAFAGLALGDSVYADTGGEGQGGSFTFDVEGPRNFLEENEAPGWFSEQSVWELMYDLVDADPDGSDNLVFPLADVWAVMTGRINTTPALTSIFPFLNAFKSDHPGDTAAIDLLADAQAIASITTDFGENETNDAGTEFDDVLPIFADLEVNGPAVNVCSTDEFSSDQTGSTNKLSSRRFLRFMPPAAGQVTIEVEATEIPDGEFADPDWILHQFGPIAISEDEPTDACRDLADAPGDPGLCVEPNPASGPASVNLINAQYVLEVYEWTNTNDTETDPEYPPIGRACFDVRVTQP